MLRHEAALHTDQAEVTSVFYVFIVGVMLSISEYLLLHHGPAFRDPEPLSPGGQSGPGS